MDRGKERGARRIAPLVSADRTKSLVRFVYHFFLSCQTELLENLYVSLSNFFFIFVIRTEEELDYKEFFYKSELH